MHVSLKRIAEPNEIAKCCYFYVQVPHITGQIIRVDGGM